MLPFLDDDDESPPASLMARPFPAPHTFALAAPSAQQERFHAQPTPPAPQPQFLQQPPASEPQLPSLDVQSAHAAPSHATAKHPPQSTG